MRRGYMKATATILVLVLMLTMLGACGSKENPAVDEAVDAAVKAALEAAVVPAAITFEADGQQITIEETDGLSIQQLLDMANITLNDGDVLAVVPDQTLNDNITVQVLRRCEVTVTVAAEDPQISTQHTAVLFGGTVADVLTALNLELADGQTINHELDEALENGMEIVISVPAEEEEEETEPTEETEATEPDNSNSGSRPNNSGSTTTPTSPPATEPSTTPTTAPTDPPAPTAPSAPTDPPKTVVSVEVYEDCDGSGHGVKVITYSDGTQEEVYF